MSIIQNIKSQLSETAVTSIQDVNDVHVSNESDLMKIIEDIKNQFEEEGYAILSKEEFERYEKELSRNYYCTINSTGEFFKLEDLAVLDRMIENYYHVDINDLSESDCIEAMKENYYFDGDPLKGTQWENLSLKEYYYNMSDNERNELKDYLEKINAPFSWQIDDEANCEGRYHTWRDIVYMSAQELDDYWEERQ